jgi:antitoxin PrlF
MACLRREPQMITSKITSKAQTTIPQAVRAALRLSEGDELGYRIEGDHVVLSKVRRNSVDDPFATFSEWSSEADERAYGNL